MAATLLSIGYPQTMVQNTSYALPAKGCILSFQGTGASVEFSNDETNWTTGAASPQNLQVGYSFARSTGANAIARLVALLVLLCLITPALAVAQTVNNPCRSDVTVEQVNSNKFFFESAFHNDRLTTGYSFAVIATNNGEIQQEWRVPKDAVTLVVTPPSPASPCYSVPFNPAEHLDRTGKTKYINKYKIHYDAPLGDSLWSSPGNPFTLMTTPFVGETRNGR